MAESDATGRALELERARRLDLERQLEVVCAEISHKAAELAELQVREGRFWISGFKHPTNPTKHPPQTELHGESLRRSTAEARVKTLEQDLGATGAALAQDARASAPRRRQRDFF